MEKGLWSLLCNEGRGVGTRAITWRGAHEGLVADLDRNRLERAIAAELERISELLTGDVQSARQGLKQLLVDRGTFTPTKRGNVMRTYAVPRGAELLLCAAEYMRGGPNGIFTLYTPGGRGWGAECSFP